MTTPFAPVIGGSTQVSASGTSADEALVSTGTSAMMITNPSATLSVAVRWGVGAQTAVLATDMTIPPASYVIVAIAGNENMVAAIATGAGPTLVQFTPGNGGY